MNKTIVAFLTVMILVLAACTPAAPSATTAPPSQLEVTPQPTPSQPKEVPPAPTVVAKPVPVPTSTKELEALLSKADQKLKSYKYLELIIPTKRQPDTVFVKGTKIRIKLYEYDPYIPDDYFDTVYLDTAQKSIVGRCEGKRCVWARGDNTKREWTDLSFERYRSKTPYEWVKSVPMSARIIGPEVHENRDSTKIEYNQAGSVVTMWVDNTYGVAVEVWVTPGSGEQTKYKFNDMLFNTLSDADVSP